MNVKFRKSIRTCIGTSSDDRHLYRLIDMPFLPPVGMDVRDDGA